MIRKSRYYLLGLYMAGFFLGIFYANFIGVNYITTTGIFHEYFLNQYVNQEILTERYFLYLLKERVTPFFLLVFAGMTRFRKIAAGGCLLWTGFAGGMLAVAAVIRMGIAGMVFYVAAIIPHSLFYVFAYLILICYLAESSMGKWNAWKSIFVVCSILAGVLTEAYINPHIVRGIIGILG